MGRLVGGVDCCMECVVLVGLVSVLGKILVFGLDEKKNQLSKRSFLIYTRGDSVVRYRSRKSSSTSINSEVIIHSERS